MSGKQGVARVAWMSLVLVASLVLVGRVSADHYTVDLFEEERAILEADSLGRGPASIEGVSGAAPNNRMSYEEVRYEELRPASEDSGIEPEAAPVSRARLEFPNSWEHFEDSRFGGHAIYTGP